MASPSQRFRKDRHVASVVDMTACISLSLFRSLDRSVSSPRPRGPEREAGAFGHGVGHRRLEAQASPRRKAARDAARHALLALLASLSLSLSLSLSPLSLSLSLSLSSSPGHEGSVKPPGHLAPQLLSLSLSLSLLLLRQGMSGVLSPPATRAPMCYGALRGRENKFDVFDVFSPGNVWSQQRMIHRMLRKDWIPRVHMFTSTVHLWDAQSVLPLQSQVLILYIHRTN